MAKYSEKLVSKIVELLEQDVFTISEICNILRISRKTFYGWMDTKPEFREGVEKARECCEEKLLMNARKAWHKKINGYILTETVVTYIPDESDPSGFVAKKKVVKTKEYPPNASAIKQVIERNDKKEARERPLRIVKCISSEPKKSKEERVLEFKRQSGLYSDNGKYIGIKEDAKRLQT